MASSALAHPSLKAQARSQARKDGIPLRPSVPLQSIPTEASFPLSPVPTSPHCRAPFPLAGSLVAIGSALPTQARSHHRCSCRDTKHVAQGAHWHEQGSRADCGAHVGGSSVRRPCKLRASCSLARTIQRRAHLQMPRVGECDTCHCAHLLCQAARHVMRASTARTGAESATCTSHATMYTTISWKTPYTMPPMSTSYTTQVCGFTRRTHGAVFKPRSGEFEARRSVRCLHEGEHDVGCIPARR